MKRPWAVRFVHACGVATSMFALASAQQARAQMCHAAAGTVAGDHSVRASVGSALAAYDHALGSGEYQSLRFGAAFTSPWLTLQAALPMHRLTLRGHAHHGVGDLGLDARVAVHRSDDDVFAFGPELAATLPTGAEEKSMGMGHAMLMPGAWLSLSQARWALLGQLAYARALTNDGTQHHEASAGTIPIIDPMNAAEIEHSLIASYALLPSTHVSARVSGAVPVGSRVGEARELIGLGMQGFVGSFDAAVELQVPVIGSPFTARLLLAVGVRH